MMCMKKAVKRILRTTLFLVVAMIGFLLVYSINPGKPLPEMEDAITLDDDVTREEDWDQISYLVEVPIANIVIVPGGKVKAESYSYLAAELANAGYNVTTYKAVLNLSILTGGYPKRFLDDSYDNYIIGHSLGGITASSIASDEDVSGVVLLGSYSITDIRDTNVLVLVGELDSVIDMEAFEENESNLGEYTKVVIEGGNHAQFGWYGKQNKDTDATITTQEQQDKIIEEILLFINS